MSDNQRSNTKKKFLCFSCFSPCCVHQHNNMSNSNPHSSHNQSNATNSQMFEFCLYPQSTASTITYNNSSGTNNPSSCSYLNETEIDLTHFSSPKEIVGIGGFGMVRRITKLSGHDSNTDYALKSTLKSNILARSTGIQSIMTELKALVLLSAGDSASQSIASNQSMTNQDGSGHICTLHYAFQDSSHIYLVLDYALSGDMRYNMRRNITGLNKFSEELSRIFIAQVFVALQYCHERNILHRGNR